MAKGSLVGHIIDAHIGSRWQKKRFLNTNSCQCTYWSMSTEMAVNHEWTILSEWKVVVKWKEKWRKKVKVGSKLDSAQWNVAVKSKVKIKTNESESGIRMKFPVCWTVEAWLNHLVCFENIVELLLCPGSCLQCWIICFSIPNSFTEYCWIAVLALKLLRMPTDFF